MLRPTCGICYRLTRRRSLCSPETLWAAGWDVAGLDLQRKRIAAKLELAPKLRRRQRLHDEGIEITSDVVERDVPCPGTHEPEIEFVGDIASLVMTTLPEQQNTAPEGAAVDRFHSSARAVEGCNHQQRAICVDAQVQIGDLQPPRIDSSRYSSLTVQRVQIRRRI